MVARGHPSTPQHADTATPAPSPQPECTWGHGQGLCFRSFNTCKIKCVSVQSAEGKGSPVSSESNLPCSSTRAVMMDSRPGQQRAASGAQCCSIAALCCAVGWALGWGPVLCPTQGWRCFCAVRDQRAHTAQRQWERAARSLEMESFGWTNPAPHPAGGHGVGWRLMEMQVGAEE